MKHSFKIVLLIIALVALFAFQGKIVMPWVEGIVASDLFMENSDDEGSQMAISNDMTQIAFTHCNTYVGDEIGSDFSVNFSAKPINAWSMGNYRYVVNADIEITPTNAVNFSKRYVCRIKYTNEEDLNLASEKDNWSLEGLSGIDNL